MNGNDGLSVERTGVGKGERRLVVACAMLCWTLFQANVACADTGHSSAASAQDLQRQIFERLASSRDAKELLAQFRTLAAASKPAASPTANRS
jgi:hypothetical protein